MALKDIEKLVIRKYLTEMWKKALGTNLDPANRQWYEKGPAKGSVGLFGGLTDTVSTVVILDESQKAYIPSEIVCDQEILDNRNGLAPHEDVELSSTYTDSITTTHSTTNSIKAGIGYEIKGGFSFVVKVEVTIKFSFEYTHSWTKSTSKTEGKSHTFKRTVPVDAPSGKVYQAILIAQEQKLVVPYRAVIYVDGITETWFKDRVGGHYNWSLNAGSAFSRINEWGLAGPESNSYGMDPDNFQRGVITQHGQVTATQAGKGTVRIYDITDSYKEEQPPGILTAFPPGGAPVAGTLVKEIRF